VGRLAELQAAAGCALRIDGAASASPLAAAIGAAAGALTAAAEAGRPLAGAVAALVGLGPGLTPSGDDFLCGFVAAARARHPALLGPLEAAAVPALPRTTALSAFLVRSAFRGFWPAPLVDLGDALARGEEPAALEALEALCRLGHSSGADLATGFLAGLAGA
jgi:hypothetical protein